MHINLQNAMAPIFKNFILLLLGIIVVCGYSFFTDKTTYTGWRIEKVNDDTSAISWARFEWTNDSLGGKYVTKTAMVIPCKIEGLPYNFTFQFDLGAYFSGIYENSLRSFNNQSPDLKNRFSRMRSPLQFWNNKKAFSDLNILFGNYKLSNKRSYFYSGYGEKINVDAAAKNDTFRIGTIGADLFKNKILIIDYPNQRFAICDTMPGSDNVAFSTIKIDKAGRVILPMFIKERKFKILFDNGSSIFHCLLLTIK